MNDNQLTQKEKKDLYYIMSDLEISRNNFAITESRKMRQIQKIKFGKHIYDK